MLELKNIKAGYGATEVLHGLSLVAEKGKITTLIGGNGAGKTTTMNCITGVVKTTSGQIFWQGRDMTKIAHAGNRSPRNCPDSGRAACIPKHDGS